MTEDPLALASATVPSSPGTYALLLRCAGRARVSVGAIGSIDLEPGLYLYLGSAFGPGGLRARIGRHTSRQKTRRWHIDYVRARTSLAGAWYSTSPLPLEHVWAEAVLDIVVGRNPLRQFGASDCQCPSHFVYFPDLSSSRTRIARALLESASGTLSYVEDANLRRLAHTRR